MGKILSLDEYKREKIKLLENDFCVKLTNYDINRINEQKSEMMVDSYARCILREKL